MLIQVISILGALCMLLGYYWSGQPIRPALQFKAILLNIIGSGVLTVTASFEHQYGFIILEGIWCLISIKNLINLLKQV